MQTFYEHLKEDNSPIDSLGHDMPMTSKRRKQLENDRGIFKDFPVDQWIDYNPPSNSSIITKQELKNAQGIPDLGYAAGLLFVGTEGDKLIAGGGSKNPIDLLALVLGLL